MLEKITPLILTFNEAPNIERTLQALSWPQEIIVVDSYSTDETLEILQSYSQVKIHQRLFDTHASQWNYGLDWVKSEWVLALDADYRLTTDFIAELETLADVPEVHGYFARFRYCVFGKPLRETLLPPRTVLFRRDSAIYIDDGHTQLLQVRGRSEPLGTYIYHDDRKPLSRWLWSQDQYMIIEAKKLLEIPANQLGFADRLRKAKIIAPFVVPIYCLVIKRGLLDGWAGWYYAFQRTLAEILLSIRLIKLENLDSEKSSLCKKELRTKLDCSRASNE